MINNPTKYYPVDFANIFSALCFILCNSEYYFKIETAENVTIEIFNFYNDYIRLSFDFSASDYFSASSAKFVDYTFDYSENVNLFIGIKKVLIDHDFLKFIGFNKFTFNNLSFHRYKSVGRK